MAAINYGSDSDVASSGSESESDSGSDLDLELEEPTSEPDSDTELEPGSNKSSVFEVEKEVFGMPVFKVTGQRYSLPGVTMTNPETNEVIQKPGSHLSSNLTTPSQPSFLAPSMAPKYVPPTLTTTPKYYTPPSQMAAPKFGVSTPQYYTPAPAPILTPAFKPKPKISVIPEEITVKVPPMIQVGQSIQQSTQISTPQISLQELLDKSNDGSPDFKIVRAYAEKINTFNYPISSEMILSLAQAMLNKEKYGSVYGQDVENSIAQIKQMMVNTK